MKSIFLVKTALLGALLMPSFSHAVSPISCEAAFENSSGVRLYPKNIDPRVVPAGHFQLSYESEYLISESEALLRDYAPDPALLPTAIWRQMTGPERIQWVQNKFPKPPEFATSSGLKRIADLKFMPEELIIDSTGNLEIVINPPVDSLEDWLRIVDTIVERYGAGSQQAMISMPREAAFAPPGSARNPQLISANLGWLVYTQLRDTFQKLKAGDDRYRRDPKKLVALSFDHPFLGPMSKIKRDSLETFLAANAMGEKYDEKSRQFVRKSDASFKYTGGPAYRPDIAGPARWSWEIRSAHKDLNDLKAKVHRDLVAHMDDLSLYSEFANVPAFDTVKEFEDLTDLQKYALTTAFPSKLDERFEYTDDERLSLDTARNFTLPFADHGRLIEALTSDENLRHRLRIKDATAKLVYRRELELVGRKLRDGEMGNKEAKARIMGLLCGWAVQSGLPEAFERKAQLLNHEGKDPRELLSEPLRAPAGW